MTGHDRRFSANIAQPSDGPPAISALFTARNADAWVDSYVFADPCFSDKPRRSRSCRQHSVHFSALIGDDMPCQWLHCRYHIYLYLQKKCASISVHTLSEGWLPVSLAVSAHYGENVCTGALYCTSWQDILSSDSRVTITGELPLYCQINTH